MESKNVSIGIDGKSGTLLAFEDEVIEVFTELYKVP